MVMDPIQPQVTITLDKERPLQFTFGAARAFKKATGRSLFDPTVWGGIDEDLVPALVWALLPKKDREELSLDDVAEYMDFSQLGVITSAMGQLYGASVPAAEGTQERPTEDGRSPSQS